MQPGCEHTRSASKRVWRRGRAEMRAPWIGPAMAIGLRPSVVEDGTTKIRSTVTTQIGPSLFPWRARSGQESLDESRRRESNPRPLAYEANALPLSYSGGVSRRL